MHARKKTFYSEDVSYWLFEIGEAYEYEISPIDKTDHI